VTWHNTADRQSEARKIVDLVRAAEGRSAILVRRRDALAEIVLRSRPRASLPRHRDRALGREAGGAGPLPLARALTHLGDRVAWLSICALPGLLCLSKNSSRSPAAP